MHSSEIRGKASRYIFTVYLIQVNFIRVLLRKNLSGISVHIRPSVCQMMMEMIVFFFLSVRLSMCGWSDHVLIALCLSVCPVLVYSSGPVFIFGTHMLIPLVKRFQTSSNVGHLVTLTLRPRITTSRGLSFTNLYCFGIVRLNMF